MGVSTQCTGEKFVCTPKMIPKGLALLKPTFIATNVVIAGDFFFMPGSMRFEIAKELGIQLDGIGSTAVWVLCILSGGRGRFMVIPGSQVGASLPQSGPLVSMCGLLTCPPISFTRVVLQVQRFTSTLVELVQVNPSSAIGKSLTASK